MSDKNHSEHRGQQHPEQDQHQEQRQQREARERDEQQRRHAQNQQQVEPGTRLPNPAQPNADTEVPPRRDASSFMRPGVGELHPSGYPKLKYHPVHGGIEVKDPGEESNLYPPTDWFDTPELADLARTHTEAEIVRFHNQIAKLDDLKEKDHPVVRNSVQADEAVRRGQTEPL